LTPLDAAESTALAKYDYVLLEGRKSFGMPASAMLSPLVTTPRLVLARVSRDPAQR